MTEMSPAEEVFFAALDKATPAERAAYLDMACADNPALRERVEKLLAAHPRVGSFLEPPPADDSTGTFSAEGEAAGAPHKITGTIAQNDPPPAAAGRAVVAASEAIAGTLIAGKYKLLQKQVLVDGTVVGTFNNLSSTAYTQLSTSSFTVTAGLHTVTFQGTNLHGGDNTVFIDQVSVVQPPPAPSLADLLVADETLNDRIDALFSGSASY
jgi:hypothetical protein